jgi:hypothetical protein
MFGVPTVRYKELIVQHVISMASVSASINLLSRMARRGELSMLVAGSRSDVSPRLTTAVGCPIHEPDEFADRLDASGRHLAATCTDDAQNRGFF